MKVLFLDFDGVMNSHSSFSRLHREGKVDCTWQWCPIATENLHQVFDAIPDLKVVISSSWRHHFTLEQFQSTFFLADFGRDRVIDFTLDLPIGTCRGDEIQEWLTRHPETTAFVIVDDNSDMAHLKTDLNFVQTRTCNGLVWSDAMKIIRCFEDQTGERYGRDARIFL